MDENDVLSKMRNANSVVDDLVYSLISTMASRFLSTVDRKVVMKVVDGMIDDYDLGKITIRKQPIKKDPSSSAAKPKKIKDQHLANIMEQTRAIKSEKLLWENCEDLVGVPKMLKDMVYCTSKDLHMEDNCALFGEKKDGRIYIYGIMNDNFQVRYVSKKEAGFFERFSLSIDSDSVASGSDLAFVSI